MSTQGLTDGQEWTERSVQEIHIYDLKADIEIIYGLPDVTKVEVQGAGIVITSFSKTRLVLEVFSKFTTSSEKTISSASTSGPESAAAKAGVTETESTGARNVVAQTKPHLPSRKNRITITAPPEVQVTVEATKITGTIHIKTRPK